MPRIVNCTGVPSSNRYQELPNCAERPYPEGKRVRVTEAYDFGESKMSVEPVIYQLRIVLPDALFRSGKGGHPEDDRTDLGLGNALDGLDPRRCSLWA